MDGLESSQQEDTGRKMREFIRRHPLLAYFVLAFAGFWLCLPLRSINWLLQFLGPFAPAVAALVVSGLTEGETSVRKLVRRLGEWRVGFRWYLVVFGLPVVEGLVAIGMAALLGSSTAARIDPLHRQSRAAPGLCSFLRLARNWGGGVMHCHVSSLVAALFRPASSWGHCMWRGICP